MTSYMEKKFTATKLVLAQEKLALDQQLRDVEEKMDVQFHIVGQTIYIYSEICL